MSLVPRVLVAGLVVVGVTAAIATGALADDESSAPAAAPPPPPPRAGYRLPVPPAELAEFFGLTADQLRTQLRAGTSLTAIATAQGKTADALEHFILDEA